jgi:hypothetical protein
MGAPAQDCCPRHSPVQTTVSESCCTLHHQPASVSSAAEAPQMALAFLPYAGLVPDTATSLPAVAGPAAIPLRLPPLIALRI